VHRKSKKTRVERTTATKYRTNKKRGRRETVATLSSKRYSIVQTAKKYLGKPYNYGGKKPNSGFDCSGFTSYVYAENGIQVKGASYHQAKLGVKKSMKDLKEGDLVFFGSKRKVSHVGIVAEADKGNIAVIHSTSSRGVVIDDITNSDYWRKKYLFGRDVIR